MKDLNIPYKKIALYLNNDLSEKDRLFVEEWIAQSADHQAMFEALKEEWKYVDQENPVAIDKDKVWEVINKHLLKNPAEKQPTIGRKTIIKIASIAASIALLFGAGASLFVKSTIDNINREESVTVVETPVGQKMLMTLPDKTQVALNSGSKLTYSDNFNKGNREITLSGEAYFEVTPNSAKEFIVNTPDVRVVVKGTSFEVSAYDEDAYVGVSLVEGSVNVTDIHNSLLTGMSPNESVKVNRSNMQYVLTKNTKHAFPLWTQEELVFYNVDLFELTRKIERWYGVKIDLIDPVVDQKYTFSVKTESIRELLDLFNKITPIEYTVNGKEVTIKCK